MLRRERRNATTYAANTEVSPDRSRAEIERILRRYGADQFMYGYDRERAIVAFRAQGRQIRFIVPLPDPQEFMLTPTGRTRRGTSRDQAWEQAQRQRWRALALAIKAKLEVVETGIATFEEEFMAYVLLPDGSTVGDWMSPQIQQMYETGKMPDMIPALGRGTVD